jgi:hypothetical protein
MLFSFVSGTHISFAHLSRQNQKYLPAESAVHQVTHDNDLSLSFTLHIDLTWYILTEKLMLNPL